jgi:uncharacterized protein DUF3168
MMEEALIAKLLADAGVAALVGTRVHPGARPQASTLPAIVCNAISANPSYSDDGEDGIAEARVQLDCWGATYSSAKTTARAVKAALSAFDGTVSAVRFRYIALDLEHDIQETGADSAAYPFRTSLDFLVVYDNA